ncbi:hypothetical protein CQ13_18350 [Bradyrhizobium retamae]|uniref:Uncharacterized protein n=1 Tax=Bradyrhizobium retamae TaxID=1300035 RepID=A0A0R3NG48_9BRAD|nr:hypothetical protein CQ13_18350 [Bradyrhizobium retamae]
MFLRVNDDVTVLLRQRSEVAFGINDRLLYPRCALFKQPPQQMGLAGSGIALQTCRQKFLKV